MRNLGDSTEEIMDGPPPFSDGPPRPFTYPHSSFRQQLRRVSITELEDIFPLAVQMFRTQDIERLLEMPTTEQVPLAKDMLLRQRRNAIDWYLFKRRFEKDFDTRREYMEKGLHAFNDMERTFVELATLSEKIIRIKLRYLDLEDDLIRSGHNSRIRDEMSELKRQWIYLDVEFTKALAQFKANYLTFQRYDLDRLTRMISKLLNTQNERSKLAIDILKTHFPPSQWMMISSLITLKALHYRLINTYTALRYLIIPMAVGGGGGAVYLLGWLLGLMGEE